MLALMGRQIRDSRSKSTVNATRTPERSCDMSGADVRAVAAPVVAVLGSAGSDLPFCVGSTTGRWAGGLMGRFSKTALSARRA